MVVLEVVLPSLKRTRRVRRRRKRKNAPNIVSIAQIKSNASIVFFEAVPSILQLLNP